MRGAVDTAAVANLHSCVFRECLESQMSSRLSSSHLFCIAALLLCPAPAAADQHIVEEVTADGGDAVEVHTWLGVGRLSRTDPIKQITTIVRSDIGKIYIVRHKDKQVVVADLPLVVPRSLEGLFNEVRMRWRLTRVGEEREIGNWSCRKVVVRGRGSVSIDIEMWVTEETEVEAGEYYARLGRAMALSPLYEGLAGALADLEGALAVECSTTVNRLGVRTSSTSRIKSIAIEPPVPSPYEPPEGYELIPLDFSHYLGLVRMRYSPAFPPQV